MKRCSLISTLCSLILGLMIVSLSGAYPLRPLPQQATPNDPYFVDQEHVGGYTLPQQWTSFDVQLLEACENNLVRKALLLK